MTELATGIKPLTVEAKTVNGIELAKITPAHLVDALKSSKFQASLFTASQETRSSGYETGFNIALLMSGELNSSDVLKGGLDSMRRTEAIKTMDDYLQGPHVEILTLHFHPGETIPIPSSQDLINPFRSENGVTNGPAYNVIGSVLENGDVALTLVQIPSIRLDQADLDEYDEKGDHFLYDQKLMQEVLEQIGCKSAVVRLKKKGHKFELSSEDEDLIIASLEESALKIETLKSNPDYVT